MGTVHESGLGANGFSLEGVNGNGRAVVRHSSKLSKGPLQVWYSLWIGGPQQEKGFWYFTDKDDPSNEDYELRNENDRRPVGCGRVLPRPRRVVVPRLQLAREYAEKYGYEGIRVQPGSSPVMDEQVYAHDLARLVDREVPTENKVRQARKPKKADIVPYNRRNEGG